MNLQQLRVFVRAQMDLDETDLPDPLIDVFIQDGYNRIVDLEGRWPFFASSWNVPIEPGWSGVNKPSTLREIDSVFFENTLLERIDMRRVEEEFRAAQSSSPSYYSDWGDTIVLSPPASTAGALSIRGFRKPDDWIAQGASAEVDADPRLHIPIAYYACAMGYAQQEDEVLEQTYMTRFREAVTVAHDSVMRTWTAQPKVLNGRRGGYHRRWTDRLLVTAITPAPGGGGFDNSLDGGSP